MHPQVRPGLEPVIDVYKRQVYETDVAGTIVAEMTIGLRLLESGQTYPRRYVAVVRAADGRVVSYREYWNPLALSDRAGATEAS